MDVDEDDGYDGVCDVVLCVMYVPSENLGKEVWEVEVLPKNKNPTLRMWGKKRDMGIKMSCVCVFSPTETFLRPLEIIRKKLRKIENRLC